MVVSGQPHVQAALNLGKEFRYPLNRKTERQCQYGRFESKENPLAPTRNRTKIPRSSSPQPGHYTDWAMPDFRNG